MGLPSSIIAEPYFNYYINGVQATDDMLSNTISVQTVGSDEKSSTAKIQIVDPTLRLFDTPLIYEGASIEIQGGYVHMNKQVFKGWISSLEPDFESVSQPPSITLNCMDDTYRMSLVKRTRKWRGVTRDYVVRSVLMQYGIPYEYDSTVEVMSSVTQSFETDLAFVQKLANAVGFTAYMKNGVFYFKSRNVNGMPKKTFYFNSMDCTLISFQPQYIQPQSVLTQTGNPASASTKVVLPIPGPSDNTTSVISQDVTNNKTVTTGTILNNKPVSKVSGSPVLNTVPRRNRNGTIAG